MGEQVNFATLGIIALLNKMAAKTSVGYKDLCEVKDGEDYKGVAFDKTKPVEIPHVSGTGFKVVEDFRYDMTGKCENVPESYFGDDDESYGVKLYVRYWEQDGERGILVNIRSLDNMNNMFVIVQDGYWREII